LFAEPSDLCRDATGAMDCLQWECFLRHLSHLNNSGETGLYQNDVIVFPRLFVTSILLLLWFEFGLWFELGSQSGWVYFVASVLLLDEKRYCVIYKTNGRDALGFRGRTIERQPLWLARAIRAVRRDWTGSPAILAKHHSFHRKLL
jgi:hypothetical protein